MGKRLEKQIKLKKEEETDKNSGMAVEQSTKRTVGGATERRPSTGGSVTGVRGREKGRSWNLK